MTGQIVVLGTQSGRLRVIIVIEGTAEMLEGKLDATEVAGK